ncbi:hypothetical protein D7004_06495, partial [Pedobacter jejuensis]
QGFLRLLRLRPKLRFRLRLSKEQRIKNKDRGIKIGSTKVLIVSHQPFRNSKPQPPGLFKPDGNENPLWLYKHSHLPPKTPTKRL